MLKKMPVLHYLNGQLLIRDNIHCRCHRYIFFTQLALQPWRPITHYFLFCRKFTRITISQFFLRISIFYVIYGQLHNYKITAQIIIQNLITCCATRYDNILSSLAVDSLKKCVSSQTASVSFSFRPFHQSKSHQPPLSSAVLTTRFRLFLTHIPLQ